MVKKLVLTLSPRRREPFAASLKNPWLNLPDGHPQSRKYANAVPSLREKKLG
jgi:hypothetical protein